MSPVLILLLLGVRTAELRHLRAKSHPPGVGLELQRAEDAVSRAAGTEESFSPGRGADERVESLRDARGTGDGSSQRRDPQRRRYDDPSGFFTTRRTERVTSAPAANASSARGSGLLNPLFPATDGAYWAYAVMLLALVLFAAGIVGNLALMCIVWHNFYLKSAWNCILAGLAFWDFLVLFFCLPVVVFHELTLKRLLGDLSCRLVPYLEVTSLGVATFSLCALSIDRFHAATGPGPAPGHAPGHAPLQTPRVESCQSILSKLSVIWLGSMVLAAPELLLWQLLQESVGPPAPPARPQPAGALVAAFRARTDAFQVDTCVREPWAELPDGVYSLVLTYQEARAWWLFGCYICLPLLFTLACDLVTRQVLAQRPPARPQKAAVRSASSSSSSSSSAKKKPRSREQRLRATVVALAVLYAVCNLPESVCNIVLAYVWPPDPAAPSGPVLPALGLAGQFLLFARCSAAPVLLLCLCRPLGQAFVDCCCCCCEECLPQPRPSSSSSSSSAAATCTTLSSPTSLTPSSITPSGKDETAKSLLEAAVGEGSTDSAAAAALGTPC